MPLRRYIFNTLTVVSLLLMLATVGLCVDSYFYSTLISYTKQNGVSFTNSSRKGIVLLTRLGPPKRPESVKQMMGWHGTRRSVEGEHMLDEVMDIYVLGFGVSWGAKFEALFDPHYTSIHDVSAPHWFLALIFAVLPAVWFIKWRKRRKLGPNACGNCGYDLTANTTGVCPECGVGMDV